MDSINRDVEMAGFISDEVGPLEIKEARRAALRRFMGQGYRWMSIVCQQPKTSN